MKHLEKILPFQYYHFYNCGINGQPIFFQKQHWLFFLRGMHHYFHPGVADIIAYCLMPTHYHLLVYTKNNDFPHSVIEPLTMVYTRAVNKQQNRFGPLFQGPYRAKWVDNIHSLMQLTRRLHREPVEEGYVTQPADWKFSSYREYAGLRKKKVANTELVLTNFLGRENYLRFVEDSQTQNLSQISHLLMH